MNAMHDAIVVGARCAGSPTAMLLARKGYRVLLLDRAGFPIRLQSRSFSGVGSIPSTLEHTR
jgi:flavin-dependent dehydrogenase